MTGAAAPSAAVLLPVPWRGGMLRAGQQMCRLLRDALGPDATVYLGVAPRAYDLARDFDGFVSDRLRVVEVSWRLDGSRTAAAAGGHPIARPEAAGVDLAACRFWVMAHAWLAEGVLDPAMPYAVYAPDFIPRYVPEIYGPPDLRHPVWPIMLRQFRMMRDARCVFATTPHTAGDAVVYAGVRRERLLTMPLFAELPDAAAAGAPADAAPYIVWVTNTTPHKNHLVALDALAIYYRELGGTLVVRACGPGTLHFAPGPRSGFVSPYWVDVALRVASDAVLRDRVQWLGEVDGDAYARLLGGAAFLWHPAAYDNGTFAAIDAGRLGRAVVSSDYPQMRHIAGEFGLAADFAPPRDPRAMAGLLKAAEDRHRAGTLTGTFAVPAGYRQRVRDAFVELVDRVGGADPAAARAGR